MKVGDLVKWKSSLQTHKGQTGLILSVGYGEKHTNTKDSRALNPDIWVLTSYGAKERWNVKSVDVISETW